MDLLKTLRENPENEELEIVLTMMEDHEELVSQGEALGMTRYVLKPFDVFSLSKSALATIKIFKILKIRNRI